MTVLKRFFQSLQSRLLPLGIAAGFVTFAMVCGATGNFGAALACGGAAGGLVAAVDPRPFLWATVIFLLLTPISVRLDLDLAEKFARVSFFLLALAVALEFRQNMARTMRRAGEC